MNLLRMFVFLYFPFLFLLMGCHSQKVKNLDTKSNSFSIQMMDAIYKDGKENLGDSIRWEYCSDSTFVLAISEKKGTPLNPENQISYRAYKVDGEKMLKEGKISNGSISWVACGYLKYVQILGIMPADLTLDDLAKVYDLHTMTEMSFRSYQKSNKE